MVEIRPTTCLLVHGVRAQHRGVLKGRLLRHYTVYMILLLHRLIHVLAVYGNMMYPVSE